MSSLAAVFPTLPGAPGPVRDRVVRRPGARFARARRRFAAGRVLVAVVAAVLGCAVVGSSAGASEEAPTVAAITAWLATTPDTESVAERAEQLRREAPQRSDLQEILGRDLVQRRVFDQAGRALEHVLSHGPPPAEEAGLRLILAATYWELRREPEAEEQFAAALDLARGDFQLTVRRQFAEFLVWRGEAARAAQLLGPVVEQRPRDGALRLLRGRALYAAWRAAEAPAPASPLGGPDGSSAPGPIDVAAEFLSTARSDLEVAVDLRPQDSEVRYVLAGVLRQLGERQQAAEQLRQYQRLYAEDQRRIRSNQLLKTSLRTARELMDDEQTERAVELLEGAAPRLETLELLAEGYLVLGRRAEAQQALQRAVALAPRRTDLMVRLNELLLSATGDH